MLRQFKRWRTVSGLSIRNDRKEGMLVSGPGQIMIVVPTPIIEIRTNIDLDNGFHLKLAGCLTTGLQIGLLSIPLFYWNLDRVS